MYADGDILIRKIITFPSFSLLLKLTFVQQKDRQKRCSTETGWRSPIIPSWLVASHKVFHFVFKVASIMVNFVLSV